MIKYVELRRVDDPCWGKNVTTINTTTTLCITTDRIEATGLPCQSRTVNLSTSARTARGPTNRLHG